MRWWCDPLRLYARSLEVVFDVTPGVAVLAYQVPKGVPPSIDLFPRQILLPLRHLSIPVT